MGNLNSLMSELSGNQDSAAPPAEHPTAQEAAGQTTDLGTDAEETAVETGGTEPAETGEEAAAETAPEVTEVEAAPDRAAQLEALVKQFAEETGFDPEDPDQRKTLNRLAEKELLIQEKDARIAELEGKKAADDTAVERLTEFERALGEPEEEEDGAIPPADQPKEVAAAPTDGQIPRYGDLGDTWKGPTDAIEAWNQAWASSDMAKVNQIEVALLMRRADALGIPRGQKAIQDIVERVLAERLGDVVPAIRQTVEDRRTAENRDFAKAELRKLPAFKDFDELFKVEEGPGVVSDGQTFPNMPINRIMAADPGINLITVSPADPEAIKAAKALGIAPRDAADRLTFLHRYRTAMTIHRANQIPPAAAKRIMQHGAQAAERQERDRARQAVNAGAGATTTPSSTPSRGLTSDRRMSLSEL